MVLRQSLAGAKRAVAPQPDPTGAPFTNRTLLECPGFFNILTIGISLAARVFRMSTLPIPSNADQ